MEADIRVFHHAFDGKGNAKTWTNWDMSIVDHNGVLQGTEYTLEYTPAVSSGSITRRRCTPISHRAANG